MAEKSLNRRVLSLAGPSILANITVPLVGIVDLAIAGHIGDAVSMGGIAIGTILFDFLYWNMGFLRIGTGGITAQAFGRRDDKGAIDTFMQGSATALGAALFCLLIQTLYVEVALMVVQCSPEVAEIAKRYFFIRIWAVPATLWLFVFKGWFIGMQNTVFAMVVDIWVNLVNMGACWYLTFRTPLGIDGIATGTVIAQWSGLMVAFILTAFRYRSHLKLASLSRSIKWKFIKVFFKINGDLFIRAFCLNILYVFFTVFAARYGDVDLAVASVMMKMLMLYSYFLDGFAFAGEALSGRYIGEKNREMLKGTVKYVFFWVAVITVLSTAAYAWFPKPMLGLITNDPDVLSGCEPYLFWLLLMPLFSCVAFTWDGIFIGATASVHLRNSVVASSVFFFIVYYVSAPYIGCQAIYLAYFAHLVFRTAYMCLTAKKAVLGKLESA